MINRNYIYLLLVVLMIITIMGVSLGLITLLVFFVSNLSLFMSLIVAAFTHVILFYMLYRKIISELKEMNVEGLDFDDMEDLG